MGYLHSNKLPVSTATFGTLKCNNLFKYNRATEYLEMLSRGVSYLIRWNVTVLFSVLKVCKQLSFTEREASLQVMVHFSRLHRKTMLTIFLPQIAEEKVFEEM